MSFLFAPEVTDLRPVEINSDTYRIPVAIERVSAGFPSPAADYVENAIDMNSHLIRNKESTFIVRASSLSMRDAGIGVGDELIVDRSLTAYSGDIVIAVVDNDFTVKTLKVEGSEVWLQAENPEFQDIHFKEGQTLVIWGVVTHVVKTMRQISRKSS